MTVGHHPQDAQSGVISGTETLWTPVFDGGRLDAIKGGSALTVWAAFGVRDAHDSAVRAMTIVLAQS
jgi:hypothetical protein